MISQALIAVKQTLSQSNGYTPIGYYLVLFVIFVFFFLSFRMQMRIFNGKNYLLLVFLAPITAAISAVAFAVFAGTAWNLIPIGAIIKNPNYETGFIVIWISLTIFILSITVAPIATLIFSITKSENLSSRDSSL